MFINISKHQDPEIKKGLGIICSLLKESIDTQLKLYEMQHNLLKLDSTSLCEYEKINQCGYEAHKHRWVLSEKAAFDVAEKFGFSINENPLARAFISSITLSILNSLD